jgi:hypothetical protein
MRRLVADRVSWNRARPVVAALLVAVLSAACLPGISSPTDLPPPTRVAGADLILQRPLGECLQQLPATRRGGSGHVQWVGRQTTEGELARLQAEALGFQDTQEKGKGEVALAFNRDGYPRELDYRFYLFESPAAAQSLDGQAASALQSLAQRAGYTFTRHQIVDNVLVVAYGLRTPTAEEEQAIAGCLDAAHHGFSRLPR